MAQMISAQPQDIFEPCWSPSPGFSASAHLNNKRCLRVHPSDLSPNMDEHIDFNAAIGPEEVGVVVGAWMFGIATIQVRERIVTGLCCVSYGVTSKAFNYFRYLRQNSHDLNSTRFQLFSQR